MRIFISYSSRYRELCERLQLALEAGGRHQVFVDRSELAPGKAFDETLRKGIGDCDLLLFLISPESVAPGSYALAELGIARSRWRHPEGRVLPVKVAPTPLEAIPAYLRAVTILEPRGDVVAETLAAVETSARKARPLRLRLWWGAAIVLAAVLAFGYVLWQKQRAADAHAATLASAARQLCEANDHALAWQRYDDAIRQYPGRATLRVAREVCGMRWLREIRVRVGRETFTDIVNRVLPVLVEGISSASGRHLADLHAHSGWADYLRARDGAEGVSPPAHYQKALAAESSNVYAHAMWGHYLSAGKQVTEAGRQHFAAAAAGARDRGFVRTLQFAALLDFGSLNSHVEALRVAGEMRRNNETMEQPMRERLWRTVYLDHLYYAGWWEKRPQFMSAMTDGDSPETFLWLYPEDQVPGDRRERWRFLLASLEQAAGRRDAALTRYQALHAELDLRRGDTILRAASAAAIEQLQRSMK